MKTNIALFLWQTLRWEIMFRPNIRMLRVWSLLAKHESCCKDCRRSWERERNVGKRRSVVFVGPPAKAGLKAERLVEDM